MNKINLKKFKNNFPKSHQEFLSRAFYEQSWLAGLHHIGMKSIERDENISNALGVSIRTAQRWLAGEAEPHPSATKLLLNLWAGLPQQGSWQGWVLRNGSLFNPANQEFTQEMLSKWWLHNHRVNRLANENRELGLEVERLKEQIKFIKCGHVETKVSQAHNILSDIVNYLGEAKKAI